MDSGKHRGRAAPISRRRALGSLGVATVMVVVMLAGVFVVRKEALEAYTVSSTSMQPTLHSGEVVMVSLLGVKWGSVNRGDVVAIRVTPKYNCDDGAVTIVKRVIGLPGDRLTSKGSTIYVNGRVLDQRWPHSRRLGPAIGNVIVPNGQYFVMGDNHTVSCDSRMWGTVPKSYIVGKIFSVVWPLGDFKFL